MSSWTRERSTGVEVGSRVLVRSRHKTFSAKVCSVARQESRCEIKSAESTIDVGSEGEVFVSNARIKRLPKTGQLDDIRPEDISPNLKWDSANASVPKSPIVQWNNPHDNKRRTANVKPAAFQQNRPGGVSRIDVRVTASSGGSIYLDKGRVASIQPGDEVVLYPLGEGIVNATIQSVSKSSSRCTVLSGSVRVDIGTRGEVLVMESRSSSDAERSQDSTGSRPVPQHPGWSHQPKNGTNRNHYWHRPIRAQQANAVPKCMADCSATTFIRGIVLPPTISISWAASVPRCGLKTRCNEAAVFNCLVS